MKAQLKVVVIVNDKRRRSFKTVEAARRFAEKMARGGNEIVVTLA